MQGTDTFVRPAKGIEGWAEIAQLMQEAHTYLSIQSNRVILRVTNLSRNSQIKLF